MVTRPPATKKFDGLAKKIFILIVGSFILRVFWDDLTSAAGLGHEALFFTNADIFADSIKQCLAVRAVSYPLLTDPKVLDWPHLFQQYLFSNPYLGPGILVYAQPPLAMLQLMAVAKIIVLASPFVALAVQFGFYLIGAFVVKVLLDGQPGHKNSSAFWLMGLLVFSYPALVMLDRGNYHAGYASVGVVLYLFTAFTGKWRWLGMIAMCYATNVRPNIAIIAIVEFALSENFWRALLILIVLGVGTILVAAAALLVAHSIDPKYSIEAFFKAYALFRKTYILHDAGLEWNDSLYGGVRSIWSLSGVSPSYNAKAANIISLFGIVSLCLFLWLAVTKRMTKVEAIFLATALCSLFTPFNGEYHILKFLAPIMVLNYDIDRRALDIDLTQLWPTLVLLLLLGSIVSLVPNGFTAILLVAGCILVSVTLRKSAERISGITASESLILTTSLLVLCPLGGALSNGLAVSTLLLTTCCIVVAECSRRPKQISAKNFALLSA